MRETRVLVFDRVEHACWEDRVLPALAAGQFIVRNTHSLVSPGTEMALYQRRHIGFDDPQVTWCRYPLDIGYASVGVVEASEHPGVEPGCRVVHYGAHAERTLVTASGPLWAPVPDGLDSRAACFARFAQIAYSAKVAAPRAASSVYVYGAGIVGNLAAQWFADGGADTTITDRLHPRLKIAGECGLRGAAHRDEAPDPASAVAAPDTVVEATGVATVVVETLRRVAIGGQVILLGSIRNEVSLNLYKQIHRKAVLLSGAHETVLGERRGEVLRASLEAIGAGRLCVEPIVTQVIGADRLPGVYPLIASQPDRYFGVVVEWGAANP